MVDFVKRAAKTGDTEPDEEVLAAVNVTPSPFTVPNAGMTGGLIAGGLVGAAAGAAWDRRRERAEEEEQEGKSLPEVAFRAPVEPGIPANGALLAVTTKRILAWRISGLGRPREILVSLPLADVDAVRWEDVETRWLGGRPSSVAFWIGSGDRVLACAAISMGPAGKWVDRVIAALDERLPGRVEEWDA